MELLQHGLVVVKVPVLCKAEVYVRPQLDVHVIEGGAERRYISLVSERSLTWFSRCDTISCQCLIF
jgi:hypothetical protein